MSATFELRPGTVLNSTYEIVRILGEGGMGTVYEATHLTLRHSVAIKTLSPDLIKIDSVRHRFLEEGQIEASLRHPNLVKVYDILEDGAMLAIVMEFVPGRTLRDFIYASERPVDQDQGVGIVIDVLEALAHAHDHGIIHRDIKPDNIFLFQQQTALVPKLGDFGIAKDIAAEGVTQFGTMLGTPYYMAPEQAIDGRDVDVRTDIYALGVTMYELFTQRLPFEADEPHQVIQAHILKDPPSPSKYRPDLQPALESAILKAMAKDRAGRHQNCVELKDALRGLRRVPLTLSVPAVPAFVPTPRSPDETMPDTVLPEGVLPEDVLPEDVLPEDDNWGDYLTGIKEPPAKLGDTAERFLSEGLQPLDYRAFDEIVDPTLVARRDETPEAELPTVASREQTNQPTPLPEPDFLSDSPLPFNRSRTPSIDSLRIVRNSSPVPNPRTAVAPADSRPAPAVEPVREIRPPLRRDPTPTQGLPDPRMEPKRLDIDWPQSAAHRKVRRAESVEEPVYTPARVDVLKWARLCLLIGLGLLVFQSYPYGHCVYEATAAQRIGQLEGFDPSVYTHLSAYSALEAAAADSTAGAIEVGLQQCRTDAGFGHGHGPLVTPLMGLMFGLFIVLRIYHRIV